ncbi:MAG: carbamoyl phosphate synthase large subunit, partial [Verrucomicrobiota bacterium]
MKLFQKELSGIDSRAKVFATDMEPSLSSACQLADGSFQVPRVTSDEYLECLLGICQDNAVRMIVPTIDTELLFLAENRTHFEAIGVEPIVSDPTLIRICRDKRKTHDFFLAKGIKA